MCMTNLILNWVYGQVFLQLTGKLLLTTLSTPVKNEREERAKYECCCILQTLGWGEVFIGSTDGSLAIAPPAPGQSLSAPVLLLAHNAPTTTTTIIKPAKKSKKCYSGNWQKAQNCSAWQRHMTGHTNWHKINRWHNNIIDGQLKAFPVLRNNLEMCTGAWKLMAQHE